VSSDELLKPKPLGLVHWDDPEGWYGEGGGRRVQDGEHMKPGPSAGLYSW